MDETELKIDHSAPSEPAPQPVPTPEPTPTSEPIPAPEPTPEPQPTLEPAKKPSKKMSKKTIILIGAISGVILLATAVILFFVFSNKPTPTTTTTSGTMTETETKTTTDEPQQPTRDEIEKENEQIKADMTAMVTALGEFQNNNDGKIPANWDTFFKNYAEDLGKKYKYTLCDFLSFNCKNIGEITWDEDKYLVHIATDSSCKRGSVVKQEDSVRRVTFYTALRKIAGNDLGYYCASNQTWYN